MMNQVSEFASNTGASIKSLAKIALQSKAVHLPKSNSEDIIIMGNGPSLRQTIDKHSSQLASMDTMAVNFAAIAPDFTSLKPKYYILVDPHFFSGADSPNLAKLWESLSAVDWPMTLIVPTKMEKKLPSFVAANSSINIGRINPVGVEGWKWLENAAFSKGLGMPRPRNVLIPAIMSAIGMGYKNIYLVGADHSWLKTISVDEENHVVSIQPHFYKEDDREVKRINMEYMNYPLHQILQSFYVAFRSYHSLRRYADHLGINIYNSTPDSFIDAFVRRTPW